MGTRRHKKYRGGVPFIPDPSAIGPAGQAREKKRYEAWLANRKVEAVEDSALEKIKQDRLRELSSMASSSPVKARIHEEQEKIAEKDIESTRAVDEKKRRSECKAHLRSHNPPLKSPDAAEEWLATANRRANPQDYAEVRDCVRILKSTRGGKTRRRKTRRRR